MKAVSDLNSPIGGEVVGVNRAIEDHLELLAQDPWGKGWLIRVKPTNKNTDHLLDNEAYEKVVARAAQD